MARYVRRLIAVLLMVTAIIVTQIPAVDVDAARVDVGDYTMDGDILVKYNGTESSVTVPNSVRTIGHEAFSGNTSITEVVIPANVETVDFSSFENCSNLQKVSMGSSVKTIGQSAFSGCSSLKSVSIPAKTSKIGSAAFAKCSSLTSIPIDSANENYVCADGVLYTADHSEVIQYLAGRPSATYAMPSTVQKIAEYAFWGAELLTAVTISSGVKEIPEYAFDNCNGLSVVTIPNSVESLQAYSFGDCVNLKKILIPKSVGYIDDDAFACSNNIVIQFTDANGNPIASDTVTPNSSDQNGQTTGTTPTDNSVSSNQVIGSDTSSIYDYVDFSENVLPGELGAGKIVGGNAVIMMSSDQAVRGVDLSGAETEDGIAGSGSHSTYNSGDYAILSGTLAGYYAKDKDITLPVNVSRVGERVFYQNTDLNSVTISPRTTSIGDFAFARSGITAVTIPEGVTDIGYAAFYHCNQLNNVTIPDTVTQIALGAFEGTPWLEQWKGGGDGNDYLIAGDGILLAYRGDGGAVNIPSGVKTIGAECFKNNPTVTSVTMPEGVTDIGEDAFNGCSALNVVTLPQSLVKLEDRAFANCPLTEVSIPSNVQEIGLGAFDATIIGSPMQTVLFEGTELPKVSYNDTATRLSGEDLRRLSFEGVPNAVLEDAAAVMEGSVLDPACYGFRGLVYRVSGEPTASDAGTLELQQCTMLPDASTGIVSVNPHAVINNSPYIMTGVKQGAFDAYQNVANWSGLKLTDIQVDGNASDELKSLISGIPLSDTGGSAANAGKLITITSTMPGMEQTGQMSAVIPGNNNAYELDISEGEKSKLSAEQALAAEYSTIAGAVIFPMDMKLTDPISGIPITKLATGRMEITLPVPSQFTDSSKFSVGVVSTNGTLEKLSSEIVDLGGTKGVKFVASHFSTYVLYQMAVEETKFTEDLDTNLAGAAEAKGLYAIRTLSKSTKGIQPKWIVAGILALISIVLFSIKSKKRS